MVMDLIVGLQGSDERLQGSKVGQRLLIQRLHRSRVPLAVPPYVAHLALLLSLKLANVNRSSSLIKHRLDNNIVLCL